MLDINRIEETMRERSSWREYTDKDFSSQKERLQSYLKNLPPSPFSGQAQFELIDTNLLENKEYSLGTYGFVKGATHFIAGKVETSYFDYEHYAFLMEHIILFATELGLGTCWLGGTFNKSQFGAALQLKNTQHLPAVSPFGLVPKNRNFIDKLQRFVIGAKKRQSWDKMFFLDSFDFPLIETNMKDPLIKLGLNMIRIAPSARNKQPWKILVNSDLSALHFFVERIPDRNGHLPLFPRLDIGIAVAHFDLIVKKLQIEGYWDMKADLIKFLSVPSNFHYTITWNRI